MFKPYAEKLRLLFEDKSFSEILRGSLYSFSAKIIASLLGIATSIITARYYGPEIIGLVAILNTILGIAGLFAVFGMSSSLLRLVPEYISRYSLGAGVAIYRKIIGLLLILATLTALVLYLSSSFIAEDIFHNAELTFFIAIASVVLLFSAINSVNLTMIRSLKDYRAFSLFELLPKVFSLCLLVFFTTYYYHLYNPIWIAFAIPVVITLSTTGTLLSKIDFSEKSVPAAVLPSKGEILSLSFPMFLTSGLQLVIAQTDIVMIGIFRSTSEVGIYSIVFALAMLASFVLNSINVMAAPRFSELYHAGKIDELRLVANKSSKLMFLTTLPILLILVVFGKIILAIYGEDFVAGYLALVFLVIGQFINAASGSVGYLLQLTGHQTAFRNIMLAAAIVNVVLNALLVPEYGIIGAAFASMISVVLWNMSAALYIKKVHGFYITYIPYLSKV